MSYVKTFLGIKMTEFNMLSYKLVVKNSDGNFRLLAEAGHTDGPIILANSYKELSELRKILKKIPTAYSHSDTKNRLLNFLQAPATERQIDINFGGIRSRRGSLNSLVADGLVKKYEDVNPVRGQGHHDMCFWYVTVTE